MKFLKLFTLLITPVLLQAQGELKTVKTTSPDGKFTFESVTNDPLGARLYTLSNGLKVYMTPNRVEPRIFTMIAVKAGSTSDPKDATGLAHYLEHMLFKGTDKYGSLDYSKEKPLLDKIEDLYQEYGETTDTNKRKEIYKKIDEVSGEAAKYAIANEYDKMLSSIGAKSTNAFTSFAQTVYINDIPTNMMDKWLKIEGERFRNPQFRLFHTELEAVYEEKNRSLDSDGRRLNEAMMDKLFPTHNYGQQTTIGTVEHLKSPSLEEIKNYYQQYYVPNNMAVILSGDFDMDEMIGKIDAAFNYMKKKEVKPYVGPKEKPIQGPVIVDVSGPDKERVRLSFRLGGIKSDDYKKLIMIDYLLSNGQAGLLDLNLNQKQQVIDAYSSLNALKDYSVFSLGASPREGQSLEEVGELLIQQLEMIKRGEFDDDMLHAVVNNLEKEQIDGYESNWGRSFDLLEAFVNDIDRLEMVRLYRDLREIGRDQIIEFANENFNENYVIGYKRNGQKDQVTKVVKPEITPVEVNRDEQSPFLKDIVESPAPAVKPLFLDYDNAVKIIDNAGPAKIHYVRNGENSLFRMYYVFDMGKRNDKLLPMAIKYLPYLGTDKMSAADLQTEFYKLGCSFDINAGDRQVYVYVEGLDRNFEKAVQLFEDLLANCVANDVALQNLISDELKERADAKLNKFRILYSGMLSYGTYGEKNPFNDVMSKEEMEGIASNDLIEKIRQLTSYEHRIFYYGPGTEDRIGEVIKNHHQVPATLQKAPEGTNYEFVKTEKKVYFAHYDMVQAEIMWVANGDAFDKDRAPMIQLYSEYYGGSMSSIVFQTIRESKALAYSTWSSYNTPYLPSEPYRLMAYVGTQADKLGDAIDGMNELLTEMPRSENLFSGSKDAIKNRIETSRIVRTGILFDHDNANRMGYKEDNRKNVYEKVPKITFEDLQKFHQDYIAGADYTLLVVGSRDKIDFDVLKKYGEVEELSLEKIFGY